MGTILSVLSPVTASLLAKADCPPEEFSQPYFDLVVNNDTRVALEILLEVFSVPRGLSFPSEGLSLPVLMMCIFCFRVEN